MPQSSATYTLITGASDGIGAAFARAYAESGRNLILVARSQDKLEKLKAELTGLHGVKVELLVQDLSQPESAKRVHVQTRGFIVSTLILNAGTVINGAVATHTLEQSRSLLQLNVTTTLELVSLYMPQLQIFAKEHPRQSTKEGGILFVASTAGFQSIPFTSEYAASKSYVLLLAEGIHDEMRIICPEMRVSCLAPGPTPTNIWAAGGGDVKNVRFAQTSVAQVVREGIRGLENGTALVVPGWMNNVLIFAGRFAPRFLSRKIATAGMNQRG